VSDDVHTMPVGDLREHEASRACWCHPKQDEDEIRLWIHNSMDRREEYEQGRKLS
jgi:hypothetical protein